MTILYVAFFYRPYNTVAAYRSSATVNYLRANGMRVFVITSERGNNNTFSTIDKSSDTIYVKWPNVDYLFNNDRVKKVRLAMYLLRVINGFLVKADFPEGGLTIWRRKAMIEIKGIIKKEKVDLIFTSSGPASTAILGHIIKDRYGIPWIAEYRDTWSNNPYRRKGFLLRTLNNKKEKRSLKNVNHIIAINYSVRKDLMELHDKPISVVYNGYDKVFPDIKIGERFTISYLGTIISGKRDPSILFSAVSELKMEGKVNSNEIQIKFYCTDKQYIKILANEFNINDIVNVYDLVDKKNAEKVALKSHALLLLSWNNEKDNATPAKLFEYLGFMKPIIAICYPGEIRTILEKTNRGIVIIDKDDMKDFIVRSICQLKNGDRHLGFEISINDEMKKFSREYQTNKLVEILNEVVSVRDSIFHKQQ